MPVLKEDLFEKRKILSVSELTYDIKIILENNFAEAWVEGEISNFSKSSAGHIYFTLKDANAQLKCAFFYNANKSVKFNLKDGLSIITFGRISVYGPQGQYQLYVQRVEPKGLGQLQLAFEQLKEKLFKEGLFDERHKKPIPAFPLNIGIVTSAQGAALRDILTVLKRRAPFVSVLIRPVKVQGEGAKEEIRDAINDFNEYRDAGGRVDVLIVGRGGGSIEDLWAFNEEIVARAIYSSKIPVISAVGHEVDYTISDFTADLRAATPSAAAEIVVKHKEEIVSEIRNNLNFIRNYLESKLEDCQQKLDEEKGNLHSEFKHFQEINRHKFKNLENRIRLLSPRAIVLEKLKQIEHAEKILSVKISHILITNQEKTRAYTFRLNALNPLAILSRGYSLSTKIDGAVIKDTGELRVGEQVRTRLARGEFVSTVESIIEN
ncbi:MAG: exodeoxyribonuclease VII large subunit [Candidatus Omnitrophota bacterium]|nr:exodeoxyribonuclease VII large subunit [Candidatus Omnitrophota bacterium]